MRVFTGKAVIGPVAALLLLAACQSNASPSGSTAASEVASAVESVGASAAPTPVATIPPDQLSFPGTLVVCIDIPYPPQEFFDASGNPTGSDVDIAAEIASRLGLTLRVENSVFDTIIAAVTTGKCDIVVSAQNLTPERLAQVDMIPYFQAGQSFVVAKGNPAAIATTDDLCGKSVAAESGTTEVDYMKDTLSPACVAAGKAALDAKEFPKDSDALAALSSGNVDAYFADSPVAGYYTVQHPDQFELAPITPLDPAQEGISVPKSTAESNHQGVEDAVVAALKSMIDDGTYLEILTKYGVEDGAVTSSDVVPVTH